MSNQLEENKRIVREWHELALCTPEEAVAKYIGRTIDIIIPAQQMVQNL